MLIVSIAAILIVTLKRQITPLFRKGSSRGVPKRSVTMPKRSAKNVSAIGIRTVPRSAKVLWMRSASAAVSTPAVTEKPFG